MLLQICSHIANGFKHFRVEGPHHKSVTSSQVEIDALDPDVFQNGAFDPDEFQNDPFDPGRLIVELDGDAAAKYGFHSK